MAVKKVEIEGIGMVSLTKRRGARSVRVTIAHNGEVRVSLPAWAPYTVGMDFVRTKRDWILSQLPEITHIKNKQRVGKAHHIVFMRGDTASVTSRIVGNEIRVLLPAGEDSTSARVQQTAEKAAIRALKKEARGLLPMRLKQLAEKHEFDYRSVTIKQLTGRWGSCSEKKDIVLNCFLMQLPWHLIDYVIMHELVHTEIMAHGPVFWDEVGKYVPSLALVRREMKSHKPVLN